MCAHDSVPALALVRQDGKAVSLQDELKGDTPVILTFISTSCTAVCPMTSQIMSQVQGRPGNRHRCHLCARRRLSWLRSLQIVTMRAPNPDRRLAAG